MYQTFGDFFRKQRIESGITLRSFSERFGYDAGNISRLERNILPPSLDDEKLAGYAKALNIKKGSEKWVLFHDLAHMSKGHLPNDLLDEKDVSRFLPAFFRTMRNKKLNKEKLEKLLELLNE